MRRAHKKTLVSGEDHFMRMGYPTGGWVRSPSEFIKLAPHYIAPTAEDADHTLMDVPSTDSLYVEYLLDMVSREPRHQRGGLNLSRTYQL